jgi:hypothetical protein
MKILFYRRNRQELYCVVNLLSRSNWKFVIVARLLLLEVVDIDEGNSRTCGRFHPVWTRISSNQLKWNNNNHRRLFTDKCWNCTDGHYVRLVVTSVDWLVQLKVLAHAQFILRINPQVNSIALSCSFFNAFMALIQGWSGLEWTFQMKDLLGFKTYCVVDYFRFLGLAEFHNDFIGWIGSIHDMAKDFDWQGWY